RICSLEATQRRASCPRKLHPRTRERKGSGRCPAGKRSREVARIGCLRLCRSSLTCPAVRCLPDRGRSSSLWTRRIRPGAIMSTRTGLPWFGILLLGAGMSTSPAKEPEEPLPPNALTRLGTSRFCVHGGVYTCRPSPDGTRFVVQTDGRTVFLD